MLRFTTIVGVILTLSTLAAADVGIQPDIKPSLQMPLTQAFKGSDSLLDLKKLKFNHTLGVSFSSGQFGGLSQYYLNDITYQVSKPLIIRAQVGVQNNLSSNTRYGSTQGVQVVVPNVSVLYQPKPNLRIEFGFSTTPGYFGNPYYYGRPSSF